MTVGAILSRLRRTAHAAFGPIDQPYRDHPPVELVEPARPGDPDYIDSEPPTVVSLLEQLPDGTRVYTDAELTADGQASVEVILHPAFDGDGPATTADDLYVWISEQ